MIKCNICGNRNHSSKCFKKYGEWICEYCFSDINSLDQDEIRTTNGSARLWEQYMSKRRKQ